MHSTLALEHPAHVGKAASHYLDVSDEIIGQWEILLANQTLTLRERHLLHDKLWLGEANDPMLEKQRFRDEPEAWLLAKGECILVAPGWHSWWEIKT